MRKKLSNHSDTSKELVFCNCQSSTVKMNASEGDGWEEEKDDFNGCHIMKWTEK